ncbi:hypothetical protein [uncultured Caulobacter sp.]|uniref:hypothetical protein n=1 Tax=uncultured Caulobacter sp. TaxID=158749 RepID=UPI0026187DC7|nr:hypothetical protein [uncultured Caulobacter sp.]
MPNGQALSYNQAFSFLDHTQVYLGSSSMAFGGAATYYYSSDHIEIYVDPNNTNVSSNPGLYGGEAGKDYAVFHEFGHVITGGSSSEALANSAGRDLAAALGFAYPTDAQLTNRGGTIPN